MTQTPPPAFKFSTRAIRAVDDVPRIEDSQLATALQFGRNRDIRKLIERHMDEIEAFGVCVSVAQTPGPQGGRPSAAYFLTEHQALLVATLSHTPRASIVRRGLIEVFVAWRRGHLSGADAAPVAMPEAAE